MKIYTRFGDSGSTQLLGGITLQKSDPKIELIGSLDELNSAIGVALSHGPQTELAEPLQRIQRELFQWGALLAGAPADQHQPPQDSEVAQLEQDIDTWQSKLPAMTNFILPGGSTCGAALHLARTICRRTERNCDVIVRQARQPALDDLQRYLNRLSDWLFVAARLENQNCGVPETKWQPRQA